MAIPYAPHSNPSDSSFRYVAGSNAYVKSEGTLARRPGFPTHTADEFGAGNTIERFFHWRSWAGAHYIFANVITAGSSRVFKQKVGTDATFQSLFDSDDTESFDFVVANDTVFYGNGTDMRKYDGTNEQKWGIAAPTVTPTTADSASGNVPAAIGHRYRYAFENTTTGHISDVSTRSDEIATASRQWVVSGSGTSDTQVDQIRVYRTEDGGSVYFELSASPIANPGASTWTLSTDDDTDNQLKSTQAPVVTINSVPTPGMGMEFFAGRIWWFINDTVYYTGFEEVNNGRFEESAPTDNRYRFGQQITGLAVVNESLQVVTRNGIWPLTGDTRSTFRRGEKRKGGSHQRATVTSNGELMAWLDVANTVQVSNGVETRELSFPIRTDIESIDHASAAMTFWFDGIRQFLVLMDGGGNALRVYDVDLDFWHVPWDITTPTGIGIAQTADGTHRLLLGRTSGSTNKPLRMDPATFADDGINYAASVTLSLMGIAEENPMMRGHLEHVILERNSVSTSDVKRLFDEDPKSGSFTAITDNAIDPPNRTAGSTLVEKWIGDRTASGRRVAIQLSWASSGSEFKVHSMSVGVAVDDK